MDGIEIEKEVFMCGTGLSNYHIHAGDSLKIRVFSDRFTSYIDKESKLKMGFDYYNNSHKSDKIYWSQEFEIPQSIKKKIRKENINIIN